MTVVADCADQDCTAADVEDADQAAADLEAHAALACLGCPECVPWIYETGDE